MTIWLWTTNQDNWGVAKKRKVWAAKWPEFKSLVTVNDRILFYVSKTNEFQGIATVTSPVSETQELIWTDEISERRKIYPYQFDIEFETFGKCQIHQFVGKVSFGRNLNALTAFLRGRAKELTQTDFETIAKKFEIEIPPETGPALPKPATGNEHAEIQWRLITLGKNVNCDVWVASNDRGKEYNNERFSDLTLDDLPRLGFEESMVNTLKLIDVIWLRRNRIMKSFEIEYTTNITKGILRMSQLIGQIPNIYFGLYLVVPNRRRLQVLNQLKNPGYNPELRKRAKYILFDDLRENFEAMNRFATDASVIDRISHEA